MARVCELEVVQHLARLEAAVEAVVAARLEVVREEAVWVGRQVHGHELERHVVVIRLEVAHREVDVHGAELAALVLLEQALVDFDALLEVALREARERQRQLVLGTRERELLIAIQERLLTVLSTVRDQVEQAIAQCVALRPESGLLGILELAQVVQAARAAETPVILIVTLAVAGRARSLVSRLRLQQLIKVVERASEVSALEVAVREPPRVPSPVVQSVALGSRSRSDQLSLVSLLALEPKERARADIVPVLEIRLEVEERRCLCALLRRHDLRGRSAPSRSSTSGSALGHEHLACDY